jgi:hypothetical protein
MTTVDVRSGGLNLGGLARLGVRRDEPIWAWQITHRIGMLPQSKRDLCGLEC